MIKLKDLLRETWNSDIWSSHVWNSDIWNPGISSHHSDSEGEELNEIVGARNFWLSPDGKIEETEDHVGWVLDNINQEEFDIDDDGYPLKTDGSIAEPEEIYELAFKLGYVRLTKFPDDDKLQFDYNGYESHPPTQRQLKEMKDFAIENGWKLFDATARRDIDLL